ncbi:hypothetical protein [Pseudoclavibacter helvolus]|uniref:hypothetical protein n=1 Tax=Pseudoclavibacter helvolus TaxID=255205 RepID=UPI000AB4A30A|nr:hypothetical protein [Pseudoclavibacter helvolus]
MKPDHHDTSAEDRGPEADLVGARREHSDSRPAEFEGFLTIDELMNDRRLVPKAPGVYQLLRKIKVPPRFIEPGSGGWFKGRDPNVPTSVLAAEWVETSPVVYIGKAGGPGIQATLHSRLGQYLGFGAGKNVGHWGGRYIWQLADARELVVCWRELPEESPRDVEKAMIQDFVAAHGRRPFANLGN